METVRVKVKYFSFFNEMVGKTDEHIHLNEPSVGGLLKLLEKKYPSKSGDSFFGQEADKSTINFVVIVNEKVVNVEHPLMDNDEVSLLHPVGGG